MKKKIKICFFAFESSMVPGVSKSLINIIDNLNSNYIPIIILHKKGEIELELKKRNIKYYIIKSFTYTKRIDENGKIAFFKYLYKRIYNLLSINKMKKIIKKENISIIHLNKVTCTFGAEVAIKYHIPFITHIREFLEEDQNREFICKKYCYKLISQSDKIIAISGAIKTKYESILDVPIDLIYNGVEIKDYISKNHRLFRDNKLKLVIVGRITPEKNQLEAVKIIEEYKKNYDLPIHLSVVGEVQNYDYYKLLLDYINVQKLNENVKFISYTKNIAEIYNNNDICIVSSKKEAFGRIVVESMLNGLIVIGKNEGAISELIIEDKNGYLYDSIREACNKINIIYENKDKKSLEMSKKNIEYAKNNFSIEKTVFLIEKLYSSLAR